MRSMWGYRMLAVAAIAAGGLFFNVAEVRAEVPAFSTDEWHRVAPKDVGLDPAAITKLTGAIRAGEYSDIHSLLVIRHDQLAVEEYFSGPDERRDALVGSRPVGNVQFNASMLHDLRSVTKSVVSILYGIARSQGAVPGVDTPVLSLFPQYPDLRSPERMKIQLRHVLSMSPGWAWDESSKAYGDPLNSETAMDQQSDRVRYVLSQPIVHAPGEKFDYDGGTTVLLASIIEQGTRMPLDRYAQKVLFGPLGIAHYQWLHYRDGGVIAASGLRLLPRDMAKIGLLYLHKGEWQGKAIVPESWVAQSTRPQVPGDFYGYQWWLGKTSAGIDAVAVGYGGQRVLVDPGQDMVVVITAGLYKDPQQSQITNRILSQCTEAAGASPDGH
jgi:CubicO group peptidase (beta-lactamase class C family)